MKKTTVVFDLDGTLLDTLQDLANAVNYALEKQGMPKRTLEEVRQFVGNGVRMVDSSRMGGPLSGSLASRRAQRPMLVSCSRPADRPCRYLNNVALPG